MQPCLVIVMGVSGSGKSLVGNYLAEHFNLDFVDGDDLHPAENVELMRRGVQMDDQTRKPWLKSICKCAQTYFSKNKSVVIACSALKKKYRQQLRSASRPVLFVFLEGTQKVISERLNSRKGHYMPASLLDSQFVDLEDPTGEPDIVWININQTKEAVLAESVEKVKASMIDSP